MSGAFLIEYETPSGSIPMVFQPVLAQRDTPSDPGAHAGTPVRGKLGAKMPANLAGRAVASSRVNDLLGLQLVPHTDFCLHQGQLGIVMGLATGFAPLACVEARIALDAAMADWLHVRPEPLRHFATAEGYHRHRIEGLSLLLSQQLKADEAAPELDFGNAGLREQLTELVWLDILCGQASRGAYGYRVALTSGEACRVIAIDNELAFGAHVKPGVAGCPAFPALISARLKDRLRELSGSQLRALLEPLVKPEEVDAAVQRLEEIHWRLWEKAANVSVEVIESTARWARPERGEDVVGALLGLDQFRKSAVGTSYLARDQALIQRRRELGAHQTEPQARVPAFVPQAMPLEPEAWLGLQARA